jgi:hypothetical protein
MPDTGRFPAAFLAAVADLVKTAQPARRQE